MVTLTQRAPVNVGGYLSRPIGITLPDELRRDLSRLSPKSHMGAIIRESLKHLPPELAAELVNALTASVVVETSLHLTVFRFRKHWAQMTPAERERYTEDYGLVSYRVVTDDGVEFIVDAFQNSVELENMKYHGLGVGTTAADQTDSALESELTTEYTGNARATGTTTEGSGANVYRTVATNTLDSGTPAVTEHGILSQAATGGGVLFDRHTFSAINLTGTNGDGIQSTYDWEATAGG